MTGKALLRRVGIGDATMGKRSDYKKNDDLSAWDLDAGCRRIVDQTTPGRRRLRDRLKRMARKRLNKMAKDDDFCEQ